MMGASTLFQLSLFSTLHQARAVAVVREHVQVVLFSVATFPLGDRKISNLKGNGDQP